jgi:hypothetical protein
VQRLTKHFATLPEYLGPAKDFALSTVDGKLFVNLNGEMVQVVQAMASDLAKLPYSLSEGLYVVGSGSTGAAETLAVLGAGYFAVILASSLALRTPHPSFTPDGLTASPSASASSSSLAGNRALPAATVDVSMSEAIR